MVICILLLNTYIKQYSDIEIIKSTYDNNEYLVRKITDNTGKDAANILAQLNERAMILIKDLNKKYNNAEDGDEKRVFIDRLTNNYRREALSESSSFHSGTSYSLNKGEKIVLCIRQKPDNSFVDLNTLTYVFLHELAHLGTVEDRSHSPIFDKNFRFILQEAINLKLYDYRDYHKYPIPYCGKQITNTPLNL